MQKAVIYCRVSDPNQVKNGHGLTSQDTRCREFAKHRNLEVIRSFHEEGVSGSLINRPAMMEMLDFLRQNPDQQTVVIIDDISRLARGLKAHLELRTAIQDAGGILQSPSIEFGEDSDSQLVENTKNIRITCAARKVVNYTASRLAGIKQKKIFRNCSSS